MTQPSSPPSTTLDVANQIVVTIAIQNKNKLRHYPRRDNDVVAYYKDAGKDSPEKPDQIRWVVRSGELLPNQYILIKAKNSGSGIFLYDEYQIPYGSNSVASGPPQIKPNKGEDLNWSYSIALMEGTRQIDFIDPMVIIKNDP